VAQTKTNFGQGDNEMTTSTWNGASADWYTNNGGDWIPPGDPGPSSAVVINSGQCDLQSGDAGISVASISITGGSLSIQDPGKTQSVSGNVSVTGGELIMDQSNGNGGSQLRVGGMLTNSSTIDVGPGNNTLSAADSITAAGLANTGTINLWGSSTEQATLDVSAPAGFGTAGVLSGDVNLNGGKVLLEFASGQITSIAANSELSIAGTTAFLADASGLTSNSALTGLSTVTGSLYLYDGASISTSKTNTAKGDLTVTGLVNLDQGNLDGGAQLSVGGTLTNSGTIDVGPGNNTLSAADTVTAAGLANTGTINLWGSSTEQATLDVSAPAGFGTAGVLSGDVNLNGGKVLLEFASGQITSIAANSELSIAGATAFLADATGLTSNTALTGLSTVTGSLYLYDGASISTSTKNAAKGDLTVTGLVNLDQGNLDGGAQLSVGGTLTNSGTVDVGPGNNTLSAADTVTAAGLANTGTINLWGSSTAQATLDVSAPAGFGTAGVLSGEVNLNGGKVLLEFKSGEITSIATNSELSIAGTTAFLADATGLTSNSALTGLSTVTGSLYLYDGASISTSTKNAAKGDLTVTGLVSLDQGNLDGGAQLSVGGTLTNSGTIDIGPGNNTLSAADTVTAAGLANTGTINLWGSSTARATLSVKGVATSSGGTINIGAFGELKAATVDVTGGSVVINASGELTATTTNVTGGTVEGVGTVTGTLNDTGGTVVGGTLNSTTGTLNVDGVYKQSGSGVLQTDINSGDSQQSSIIAVTGTSGTPGAAGSANLNGGTLLIDAQTSLALNTPYTVMTFGAGDLYGEFAQVETEGSLGSFTGNGDSVTVGNGKTLEVLYNEAAGDIQVELVTTPSNTTYDWDIGAGTWNASSGADWNPPNNGTVPSQTSNVDIGTGGGGTVTLAADQTISSLSITDGYTLSGKTHSIATTGSVSVASGAVLSIDDMNVGTTFADDGAATFAGYLTINGSGSFTLSNGSLSGGINGTGTFETASGTTDTLTKVTISKGTTFTTISGSTADISGTMTDKGTFVVDGSSGNAIVNLISNVTLSGGGTVTMEETTSGTAYLRGGGFKLTNSSDTIEGAGLIGDSGALTIINSGTIDADSSGQDLNVNQGGGDTTNTGTLEATGGGTLQLFQTITNTGGAITATGTGSTVNVDSATVIGGTLNTSGGGVVQTVGSSVLTGATISTGSTYTTGDGATTQLNTSLTNEGTFLINGSSGNAIVNLGSNLTLSGGGTLTMESSTGSAYLRGSGVTLTNDNNTIQGAGNFGDSGALTVHNEATIDANVSGQDLNIGQGGGNTTNTGTLEATRSATLNLYQTITNTGANITASGSGSTVNINDATIVGGTLTATGSNVMQTAGGSAELDGVTISSGTTYTNGGSETVTLVGAFVNDGTLAINGATANSIVNLGTSVTLSGDGTVTMSSGSGSAYLRGSNVTLTNKNNTIKGSGNIGDSGALTIDNEATIDANVSGENLNISSGGGSITNTGTLEATGGGTLNLYNTVTNTGATITASGSGSTVDIDGATIVGGTLTATGSNVMQTVGGSAELDDVTISSGTTYTNGGSETMTLEGAIVNDGTFAINGASGNSIVNLGTSVTLSGGGTITMSSGSGSAYLRGSGVTLTDTNNTIQGEGNIGDNGALALDNETTIDANVSGQNLNLNGGGGSVTNTGTLEATGGGTLQLLGAITNTGGAITANGSGSTVDVDGATVTGGTLNTSGGGVMQTESSADLSGVTISSGSTYAAAAGTTTALNSSLTNKGTFVIDGVGSTTIVNLGSSLTLSGGGTVTLETGSGGDAYLRGSGVTLTNSETIQGAGYFGDSGALAISNSGTIDANSKGENLNIGQGGGSITNTGTLEATAGGYLYLAQAVSGAGTLQVGANSTVELGGATSENATFLSATAATLLIDNATTAGEYSGVLNSFAVGDILELGSTNATSATPTSYNGTDTTLTVDLNSGGPLTYTLAGKYTGDTFSVSHSGSNSLIEIATDPAFAEAASLLGGYSATPFIESSSVFGASYATSVAQLNLVASQHAHS
jgi:hypothetical protein